LSGVGETEAEHRGVGAAEAHDLVEGLRAERDVVDPIAPAHDDELGLVTAWRTNERFFGPTGSSASDSSRGSAVRRAKRLTISIWS